MPVLIVEPKQSYPKWIHSALLGHDLIVQNEAEHRKHLTVPEPAVEPARMNKDTELEWLDPFKLAQAFDALRLEGQGLFDAVPAEFLEDDSQDDAKFENVIVPFDDVVAVTAGRKKKKAKG